MFLTLLNARFATSSMDSVLLVTTSSVVGRLLISTANCPNVFNGSLKLSKPGSSRTRSVAVLPLIRTRVAELNPAPRMATGSPPLKWKRVLLGLRILVAGS